MAVTVETFCYCDDCILYRDEYNWREDAMILSSEDEDEGDEEDDFTFGGEGYMDEDLYEEYFGDF